MPVRKPVPVADPVGALGEELAAWSPEQLETFLAACAPEDITVIEHAMARSGMQGWRSSPAAMAAHFNPGYNRWRYVELLSTSFAQAAVGVDPHQIWELPSQYGKTTMIRNGIVWLLDRDPTLRIMYLSYDADKAVEEGRAVRDFAIEHQGELSFRLRTDQRSSSSWKTEQGGGLYATGINGAITGFPEDVLLLDDLIKGWQAAHSPAQREFAWNVYRSQARMRLQSNKGMIIAAGTRWHEDDPAAKLMAAAEEPGGDQWKVIRLPAIAEAPTPDAEDRLLREPDPLGRAPGEVLEPARFPPEEVHARRVILGSYLWSAMEQQRPAPEEGGEIMRGWWRWYDSPPPRYDDALTSWDMKLKDKEGGDFVAGQAWGRTGSDFWFVDQLRGQWNLVTTKTAIVLMFVRHPEIVRHVIENTGNGPEVMEQLRAAQPGYSISEEVRSQLGITDDEVPRVNAVFRRGMTGILPENPKGDKTARARAQTPLLEAGNVHLPNRHPGALQLVNEAAAFPRGANDDSVDAWSQAMKRLGHGTSSIVRPPSRPVAAPKPGQRASVTRIGRPGSRRR